MPLRKERSWNVFDRWLKKHPTIQQLLRRARSGLTWQVVRRYDGNHATGQLVVQTAGGGKGAGAESDYTDLNVGPLLEQQGLASDVRSGARGLVYGALGGVPGSAAGLCMRKMDQRPTVLEEWDVCLYHHVGSRVWLKKNGEVRLESGLADYKEDPADLDEGAKLRLHLGGGEDGQGRAELYGEDFVQQRAQPAGGTGASATTKLEAVGKATFMVDDGAGTTATITMLAGAITIENSAGAKVWLKANGQAEVLASAKLTVDGTEVNIGAAATKAAARSDDPVNPGAPMGAWALVVETAINILAPGTFVANTFALTVAAPPSSGNFATIGTGSTTVKIK
jgi:phage gp45-like